VATRHDAIAARPRSRRPGEPHGGIAVHAAGHEREQPACRLVDGGTPVQGVGRRADVRFVGGERPQGAGVEGSVDLEVARVGERLECSNLVPDDESGVENEGGPRAEPNRIIEPAARDCRAVSRRLGLLFVCCLQLL
jgi:hypothetical protein